MSIYRIKVFYRTGDSFKSYDETDYLDGSWSDIKIVEENLKRIKIHWEWHDAKENKSWHNPKKENLEEPYCVKRIKEGSFTYHSLILLTDDNVEYLISPPWCGYFERLISASVELDMKVEF